MVTCFGLRQSKKGLDKENRKKQNETCRWWSDLFRCSPEQIFTVRVSSVYSCFLGLNWIEGRENQGFPGGIVLKKIHLPVQELQVRSLCREDPYRRTWQHTSVFLPGKSYGQRSLVGYCPWGCKRVGHNLTTRENDLTEWDRVLDQKTVMLNEVLQPEN